jgi:hypothetical protein
MSATLTVDFEDYTGQSRHRVGNVPPDATLGELLAEVTERLDLPDVDPTSGQPILYQATMGTQLLNPSDRIGDVVEKDQIPQIQLTKHVTAG